MDNLLKDMGKRIFDRRKQLNMTPGNSGRAGSCHTTDHLHRRTGTKGYAT